jgi:hypothetical protein
MDPRLDTRQAPYYISPMSPNATLDRSQPFFHHQGTPAGDWGVFSAPPEA